MIKKTLSVIFAALLLFTACQEQEEKKEERIIPVKVFEVRPDSISNYIKTTGSIKAGEDAIVYAKIAEKIVDIKVDVGDKVKSDQILAEQYNQTFQKGLEIAKSGLNSAKAQMELAEQDFERMKKLKNQNAVSPQQYDQAKTQFETAQNTYQQAKNQLAQAEESLQNSYIKAPFSGIVAAIYFEEDQMANPGQPVVKVVNPDFMKAKLKVSGGDVNIVKKGLDVKINFTNLENSTYYGYVNRTDKALDNMTTSLEVEVILKKTNSELKSGMFGEFLIETKKHSNTIIVPDAAVQQQTEVKIDRKTGVQEPVKKYYVFKIEDGTAKLQEVEPGIRQFGRLEITKGLNVSDKIVVVGQNIVRDGSKVKIVE